MPSHRRKNVIIPAQAFQLFYTACFQLFCIRKKMCKSYKLPEKHHNYLYAKFLQNEMNATKTIGWSKIVNFLEILC